MLPKIESESIGLAITSPPYWGLRNYGIDGQLGNEPTLEEYLDNSIKWIREIYRSLNSQGSFVLNIGDSWYGSWGGGYDRKLGVKGNSENQPYGALGLKNENRTARFYKPKNLISVSSFLYCKIVSETDFICRGEHIWCKPNVPTSIRSRLKHSHEKLFWFVKDADKYYFDAKPWIKKTTETTRKRCESPIHYDQINSRGHDRLTTKKVPIQEETIEHSWRSIPVGEKQNGFELSGKLLSQHIAPFPSTLITPYVLSLTKPGDTVLDPFLGSGTSMRIAMENQRNSIGVELNPDYVKYAKKRLNWGAGLEVEYSEV